MLPVIHRGINPRVFNNIFDDDFFTGFFGDTNKGTMPAVNISESNEDFRIELAAPGYKKEEFKIDLDKNVLTISVEQQEKKEEGDDKKILRCEYRYSSFSRAFTLPDSANSDKINASYDNGLLTVNIPKHDSARTKPARQINIK
ncbi:MAG: Hsp20/alpha crystallin family protein [Bacteroidales bacterium]